MTWIITRTGRRFDLSVPTADMVDPVDIAHSLSMQCRFNGHCQQFYSVAQHCLLVADLVPAEHKLAALLHDATEAYVGDLVRPLKEGMRVFYKAHGIASLYHDVEHRIWAAICERFGLATELPPCVHDADMIALATERRDLLPDHPGEWECLAGTQPAAKRIERGLPPSEAAILYQQQLLELLATTHRRRASA